MTGFLRKADPLWKDAPLVDEREVFTELADKSGSSLFLGRYSLNVVLAVLDKRGFLKEARKRFLWPLAYKLDSSEHPLQRLQIFLREPGPLVLKYPCDLKETYMLQATVQIVFHVSEQCCQQCGPEKTAVLTEWITDGNLIFPPVVVMLGKHTAEE